MATRKTTTKTTKTTTKSAKTSAKQVVIPPWPGISEEALRALATKIDKAKDSYRISDMIRKVNGDDWRSRVPIAWHLVACRAVHPEANPHLLSFLEDEADAVAPDVVMDMLVRLPDGSSKKYFSSTSMLMDGYSLTIDKLLFDLYQRAADVVRARASELNASIRLGLSFVQRRLGETISAEDSAVILEQLARYQARDYGLTTNHDMPVIENGELVSHRLADLAAVKKLASLFGTEEAWNKAFLPAALEGKWNSAKDVRDAFLMATPKELAQLVNRVGIDTAGTLSVLVEVLPKREDDPDALLEAALTVTEEETMREMLLMGVVLQAAKQGKDIPEKLDAQLSLELLDSSYEGVRPACSAWFKRFPRERALVLARKFLQEDYKYSRGVAVLAVHFDPDLLRTALEKDVGKNYIGPETLGGLGVAALKPLEWAYEQEAADARRSKHRALMYAMIKAGETAPIDEHWERYLDFDVEGGKAIEYYSSSDAKPREMILQVIPEPRRSALLLKLLGQTKHPDRILQMTHLALDEAVVDTAMRRIVEGRTLESSFRQTMEQLGEKGLAALCKHIGLSQGDGRFLESLENALSHQAYQRVEAALQNAGIRKETPRDALVRMAAAAEGPKERIYVLQVDREGYDPKPGTLARSGGKAPGLSEDKIPKDKSGEPLTHLYTLDLDEIPELKEKFPGARALAFFCPEPNSGDRSDELEWVPIDAEAIAALPNDDEDNAGQPIAIVPLDVPSAVFNKSEGEGSAKEMRKMIFNAAGHVFGEPFWIQEEEGEGDFIMQINEGLCDVNLGDSGSLYVFGWGTVFQCY